MSKGFSGIFRNFKGFLGDSKGRVKKKTDYLVTSIKRVGRYLAEITIS